MDGLKNHTHGRGWIKGTWSLYDTQYLVSINYLAKKSNWVCELNLDGKITGALGPSYLQAFENAKYRVYTT